MPFRSVKQRRFLAWRHPDIYRRWKAEHGTKVVKMDLVDLSKAMPSGFLRRVTGSAPDRL